MKALFSIGSAAFAFLLLTVTGGSIHARQLAFPGAEGFGRFAAGGRGGTVYHVTNLNNSGEGSFRDAVSKPNRTVVFDVAGVIRIEDKIRAAENLTIAGQTAPGAGVVVYGNGISFSSNTIVRYMRLRGSIGMSRGACVLVADSVDNVIFDHVSVQWGRWDNLHIKDSRNVTMQHCLIGESIDPQRFGALFENPENVTIHHCLWINNQSRNPKGKAGIEYINNVVYNWGVTGFVGGHSAAAHYQDLIGNYFIAGPNSNNSFIGQFSETDHLYYRGNLVDLDKNGVLNGRIPPDTSYTNSGATIEKQPSRFTGKVTVDGADAALQKIIRGAGASLHRDAVDARLIGYLKSYGKAGVIFKTEAEAGGQPPVAAAKAPADTDRDGMPDTYEALKKLNPNDPSDAQRLTPAGYTNLELYIHSLVP
jgi:pectate lyase